MIAFDILKTVLGDEDKNIILDLDFDKLETAKNEREIWLEEKKGKFSASTFFKLMGFEDSNDIPKGAHSHIIEKVLEIETDRVVEEKYKGKAVERGKLLEVEAVVEYIKKTGKKVTGYGKEQRFVKVSNYVGVTPDGFVEEEDLIETKCPDSTTHYNYIRFLNEENFKEICNNYYWQVQGQLWVTGRKKCYFVSYDPSFKNPEKRLFILEINRNETDILKLKKRLFNCVRELQKQLKEFNTNN